MDAPLPATLRQILTPPQMSDPDLQRRTTIGYYLLLLSVVLTPLLGLFSLLTGAWVQAATTFSMTGLFLATLLLMRRRRVVLATRLFLVLQWILLAVVVTFFSGGLSSPGFVVFFLGIILSGFMDTGRSALVLTIATILLAGYLTVAELGGTLPSQNVVVPLTVRWFIYSVSLAISGAGIYLAVHNLRDYIARLKALNGQNEELLLQLQESNVQLTGAANQLRQQNAYLASLHEVSLSLVNRLALPDLLQAVVVRQTDLVPQCEGFLYLYDEQRDRLILRAATGKAREFLGQELAPGKGISGTAFARGQRIVVDDYGATAFGGMAPGPLLGERGREHAVAALPLQSGDEMFGVIGITRIVPRQPFSDAEISLLDRFADLTSIALDNARLYSAAQQELAERRQAERDLLVFRTAIETTIDGVALFAASDVVYVNEALAQMFGYESPAAVANADWRRMLAGDSIAEVSEQAAAQLEAKGEWRVNMQGVRQDGTRFPCEASLTQLDSGETVVVVRDLTEQEQARQALIRSEATSRALLDAIPDAMFRITRDGTVLDAQIPSSFGALAVPDRETPLSGRTIADLADPEVVRLAAQAMEASFATGEVHGFEYYREAGGRHVDVRLKAITDDEVVFIVRDITDRRRAEEALRQAHKLESLGVLAGGVAHDFNNLLTGILAQTSLAAYRLPEDSPVRKHVDRAMRSAERAADLTRQLLAYAGKAQFAVGVLNLNEMIRENAGLLETAIPRRVTLRLALAEDLPTIEADPGQIQQVLMNLVINGAEAVGDDTGDLLIATEMVVVDENLPPERFIGGAGPAPGEYVALTVTDSGCGIAPEALTRIFDPFFSTKADGRGLGLSSTLGIIRTHGGALEVHSRLHEGTSFRVFFPIGSLGGLVADKFTNPVQGIALEATVLVVDDEDLVREAARDILESAGIRVLSAADGEAGVALFREHAAEIDCVLLDMKMPGLDGEQTLERLREIDPDLQCIFSSGYSETELRTAQQHAHLLFLQKPYTVDQLLRYVQRVVERRLPPA